MCVCVCVCVCGGEGEENVKHWLLKCFDPKKWREYVCPCNMQVSINENIA